MDGVTQEGAPYSRELVRTVTLKDGFAARIRPIRPDDEPRLVDLYERLSRHTAYQRFYRMLRLLHTRTRVEDGRTEEGVTGLRFRCVPADATPR